VVAILSRANPERTARGERWEGASRSAGLSTSVGEQVPNSGSNAAAVRIPSGE